MDTIHVLNFDNLAKGLTNYYRCYKNKPTLKLSHENQVSTDDADTDIDDAIPIHDRIFLRSYNKTLTYNDKYNVLESLGPFLLHLTTWLP